MKKILLAMLLMLFGAIQVQAQTTTVSGTISDANGQAFVNGTWQAQLIGQAGYAGPFTAGGITLGPAAVFFSGSLNASGAFSQIVTSNNFVTPTGSQWSFTVCPAATAPCTTQTFNVTGSTLSLTSSLVPPGIKVLQAGPNIVAYTDAEIVNPVEGTQYWNPILITERVYHSGAWANTSSASSVGSALNVKSFGAVGNALKIIDAATGGTLPTITSASYTFTQADVGKRVYCVFVSGGTGTLIVPFAGTNAGSVTPPLITSVAAGVATYGATAPGGGGTTGNTCVFGTDDTAAFTAAVTAALVGSATAFPPGNVNGPVLHYIQDIYAPASGYMLASRVFLLDNGSAVQIPGILGDGEEKTVFYMRPDWPTGGYVANTGVFIQARGVGARFENFSIDDMAFMYGFSGNFLMAFTTSSGEIRNVRVDNFCNSNTSAAFYLNGVGNTPMYAPWVADSACPSSGNLAGGALFNSVSTEDVYSMFFSNTGQNLAVQNITGGSSGQKLTFHGGFVDEETTSTCVGTYGGAAFAPTCIVGSKDVDFIGTTLIAANSGGCVAIDATSEVRGEHPNCQPFGSNNGAGWIVANGGTLHLTMGETLARGAGNYCYNFNASGIFEDNGDNKCTLASSATIYQASSIQPATFPMTTNSTSQLGGRQLLSGIAPSFAVTGFGASPTVALQTAATDAGGSVLITAGTAPSSSGTFTLTFTTGNGPYGTNPPICTFNLQHGTGTWGNTTQEPIIQTVSTTSVALTWNNTALGVATALTAASTYGLNWNCYGH